MKVNRMRMNNLKNQLQNARMMGFAMNCPEGTCVNCPAHMETVLSVGGDVENLTQCKLRYIMGELQNLVNLIENGEKANDVCKNFAREQSTKSLHYYHEETPHGSNYIHKSHCWNMWDLEHLTHACKKSKCVFVMRNEHSVYVFSDY